MTAAFPSENIALPAQWTVTWVAEGAAVLRTSDTIDLTGLPVGSTSLSLAFSTAGLSTFQRTSFPIGPATILIRAFPTHDEMWCLWMLAARERGEDPAPAWEAVTSYVDQVRQGLWPDRTSPECAPQAIYLALAQDRLLSDKPDRAGFLSDALALCLGIATAVERGAHIGTEDLLANEGWLDRYRTFLRDDQKLYREDRRRGQRFRATIPATAHQPVRRVPLLVLSKPIARMFKLWARTDSDAPGGEGFPLLLVEVSADRIVLSADPMAKVELSWLATALSVLEEKAAPGREVDPWYDGSRHGGTLVASPKQGTALTLGKVLGALRRELRLRRAPDRVAVRRAIIGGCAIAAAVIILVAAKIAQHTKVEVTEVREVDRTAIARNARDAVYLLAERLDDGKLHGLCTTFAIGPHALATAAHCLDGFPEHAFFAVRNEDESAIPLHITRSAKADGGVDVGVFCTEETLAATVKVADAFDDVQVGSPLALYGFPGATADAARPSAHFMPTEVARLRSDRKRRWIEYSATTYGGMSGAPVFDGKGRVVAVHSGEWLHRDANQQATEALGLSFGTRADHLLSVMARTPCESGR